MAKQIQTNFVCCCSMTRVQCDTSFGMQLSRFFS